MLAQCSSGFLLDFLNVIMTINIFLAPIIKPPWHGTYDTMLAEHRAEHQAGAYWSSWKKTPMCGSHDKVISFHQGQEVCTCSKVSRPSVWPTQPFVKWIPKTACLGVKWLGHAIGQLMPSSAEVKNEWRH